ncbi:MAG: TonB-dependent receptor [Tannerellaceae bacterium]|jgi:TonB-linked SusC/RagA family outer membrane protein|nr:TonB-dependent receptor [Tannerellaceae bacterium]
MQFRIKQTLLTMFFFLLICSNLFARLSQKINIRLEKATIEKFFTTIESRTDYTFMYKNLDLTTPVSIVAEETELSAILDQVLSPLNIEYEMSGKRIVLKDKILISPSENKTIRGSVTETNNEPAIGASVQVKGTTTGTITDINGNFTLNVEQGAILVITYIGYKSVEINVGNREFLAIKLEEDVQLMEEVVVVGYGVQRKSDVTGSISAVTAEDILARPQFSALEGLKGKAAGVSILSTTGNPLGLNGEGPKVIIRGMNSINTSSNPLYVVDGVQMVDFHYLNPNDIERIEVLKDASSTAIYGARGANGVILVTTKRGNIGEGRTVVSYNGYISLGTMASKVDLMNSSEFLEMEDIAFSTLSNYKAGQDKLASLGLNEWIPRRTDPMYFDANGNPLYDTDWQEEVTRSAISHSHQLNVQHQNKSSSVGAFLNYTEQEGILINNYVKRVNAKLSFDTKPKRWLDILSNILVNHSWGNTSEGGGVNRNMWEMSPLIPVKFPDGRWGTSDYATELDYSLEGMANPVEELERAVRNRVNTKIFGNFGLVFHITDGLDLKTQFGVDYNTNTQRNALPNDLRYISSPNGRANLSYRERMFWQEETFLSYNKVIKDHRVNATLGASWSRSQTLNFDTGNVTGFTTNDFSFYNLAAGSTPSAPTSSYTDWAIHSVFARASYTFKDKYMTTLTLRADGSSRFGANNKYGFFPSAGLGWNISNEDFLKDAAWLSNLKLHTSYGRTGNTEIQEYRSLSLMTSSTILLNGGRAATTQMNNMPNPDLTWEKTDQFDVGINLGLFGNRLNLDLDFYHKATKDLLLERPIPYETGFASVYYNMGQVDNTGIDLLLSGIIADFGKFSWESTLNMNFNKNEIKKLGENDEDIRVNNYIWHRVGYPLGSFNTQIRLGIWGENERAEAEAVGAAPGVKKLSAAREFTGQSGIPKYTGSFINKFKYGNFDLTLDLQFVTGVETFQTFLGAALDRAGVANGLKLMLTDGWRPNRTNTMFQQIRHTSYAGQSSGDDSFWVADGSYLRGNLIQLGYTFDKSLLKKYGMNNLRLNFSISNAFLITSKDFYGYDPEASDSTGKFQQNTFFYQYPRERTFTLGANFDF